MSSNVKKGLGKGLSALISQNKEQNQSMNKAPEQPRESIVGTPVHTADAPTTSNYKSIASVVSINIDAISANPHQPRKHFDQAALDELSISIKQYGVIQPILVQRVETSNPDNPEYYIIAGERRWRAADMAGLHVIPCIIKSFEQVDTQDSAEYALIENIQRKDLNPIEEGEAYANLVDTFGYTQDALSARLGKSRSHIANMLRIVTLPPEVKEYIIDEKLSFGHGKLLVNNINAAEIAHTIVEKALSVRQTEHLIKTWGRVSAKNNKTSNLYAESDDDMQSIADSLTERLGMKVTIENSGPGGKIIIAFNNLEQLDNVISKISVNT